MIMNVKLLTDALLALFGLYLIRIYISFFRQEAVRRAAYRRAAWAAYTFFLYMVMFSGSKHPLFTLFGNIVLLAALLSAYGCGDTGTVLFRACIYHASRMVVELVVKSILLALPGEDSFAAGSVISSIAMYIILQIYRRWKGQGYAAPLPFRYWVRLFAVPVLSMFITYHAYAVAMHSGKMTFYYFLSLLIILVNYLVFDLYDKMSAQALMERQNMAYGQEISLCVEQAKEREEAYRQTQILRHDLKGRLVALEALLEAGQTEKARETVTQMLKENSLNRYGIAETGNLALDALVNYKYAAATAEDVQMSCRLEVPAEFFAEGVDMCVILENLLDNALEAVRELPEGERQISLTVRLTRGVLMITVENPYQGEIRVDGRGRIRSSKTGDHGIGLLSVERTAEKYAGTVSVSHEGGIFRVSVMLVPREILQEEP